MSADLMITCLEDESYYEGSHPESAVKVGETSMGLADTEFGLWLHSRYCGIPSLVEQMMYQETNIPETERTNWFKMEEADVAGIKHAFEQMNHGNYIKDKDKFFEFLESLIGKKFCTHQW